MDTSTATGARYVAVFDSQDLRALSEDVPHILEAAGLGAVRYFSRLGIAIVESSSNISALESTCREREMPLSVLPETTYHAITAAPTDTAQATWGLQAIGAVDSPYTGKGIKVAVLDTGVDTTHPDFAGRDLTAESFIDGEGPDDGHGHGTHCVGTACGPRVRTDGPGYGVAPEAEIYSGKVLGADGTGNDTSILSGVDWALRNGCHVISMSLGADIRDVHPPYVAAGRRALQQGALIIAAAGNNAKRHRGDPGFVGAPANSPYVMAVGAVDSACRVADFSARAIDTSGGEVDIAGPGVDIYSSWVAPARYRTISGTSMATPHVSGVAALLAQATGARGQRLWDEVVACVQPLSLPREDVGAGLSVAPARERGGTDHQDWVLTVRDEHADDIDQVADQLRSRGLEVTRVLPAIAMIHVRVPTGTAREVLVSTAGVASADRTHQHRIR